MYKGFIINIDINKISAYSASLLLNPAPKGTFKKSERMFLFSS